MSKWTLFSNHGHVLVVLSRDPDARLRDVAQVVGITERAVQKIVRDLQDGGLVSVTKQGRRNRYHLHPNQPLRHTLEAHCTTGELLDMVNRHAPGYADEAEAPAVVAAGPRPRTARAMPKTDAESEKQQPARRSEPRFTEKPGASAGPGPASTPQERSGSEPEGRESDPAPPRTARKSIVPDDDDSQGSLF